MDRNNNFNVSFLVWDLQMGELKRLTDTVLVSTSKMYGDILQCGYARGFSRGVVEDWLPRESLNMEFY